MAIHLEQPQDIDAIRFLTTQAFVAVTHSNQTEAAIIDARRAAGVLALSLVAVEGEESLVTSPFAGGASAANSSDGMGLGRSRCSQDGSARASARR